MIAKCPGRLPPRNLDSVVVCCPTCRELVEIFTDEPRRRCKCGQILTRETNPTCAQWCPAAPHCLGLAVDERQWQEHIAKLKDNPRAREFKERLRALMKERMQAHDGG